MMKFYWCVVIQCMVVPHHASAQSITKIPVPRPCSIKTVSGSRQNTVQGVAACTDDQQHSDLAGWTGLYPEIEQCKC